MYVFRTHNVFKSNGIFVAIYRRCGFRVALSRSLTRLPSNLCCCCRSSLFSLRVLCVAGWLWKCARRAFVAVYSIRMDCSSYSHAYTCCRFNGIGFWLWWLWMCGCGCERVYICMSVSEANIARAYTCMSTRRARDVWLHSLERNKNKTIDTNTFSTSFQYNIRSWGSCIALRYNICAHAIGFFLWRHSSKSSKHSPLILIRIFSHSVSPKNAIHFLKFVLVLVCTKSSLQWQFSYLVGFVWQINESKPKLRIITEKYVPFHCLVIFFGFG